MATKSLYTIETRSKEGDTWFNVFPFRDMQKSYAFGAWDMLKSFYNHNSQYRLLKDGVQIDYCGYQKVSVS